MPSLQKVNDRFTTRIEVIENGSGFFQGIVDEPSQGSLPSYQFTNGRRVLRMNPGVPVKASMVIKTAGGAIFIVGNLGDDDTVFQSFRLFETTGRYTWQTRGKRIDPVTKLPEDTGIQVKGSIWGTYEPGSQEIFDRQLHLDVETGNFITNADIQRDDLIDGKRVTRVDRVLGVKLAVLA
jgi:hypothetical protein